MVAKRGFDASRCRNCFYTRIFQVSKNFLHRSFRLWFFFFYFWNIFVHFITQKKTFSLFVILASFAGSIFKRIRVFVESFFFFFFRLISYDDTAEIFLFTLFLIIFWSFLFSSKYNHTLCGNQKKSLTHKISRELNSHFLPYDLTNLTSNWWYGKLCAHSVENMYRKLLSDNLF